MKLYQNCFLRINLYILFINRYILINLNYFKSTDFYTFLSIKVPIFIHGKNVRNLNKIKHPDLKSCRKVRRPTIGLLLCRLSQKVTAGTERKSPRGGHLLYRCILNK